MISSGYTEDPNRFRYNEYTRANNVNRVAKEILMVKNEYIDALFIGKRDCPVVDQYGRFDKSKFELKSIMALCEQLSREYPEDDYSTPDFIKAIEYVLEYGKCTGALIQRKLCIGITRSTQYAEKISQILTDVYYQ